MLPTSVLIALVPFAVAGPIARRQGLGSGIPGLGGSKGGLPSIPGLPGSGDGGSSGGLPSIPGLGSGGSAGGLPSLPTGLPKLPKLPIGGGLSGLIPGAGGSTGGDTPAGQTKGSKRALPSIPGLPGSGGSSGGLPSIPGLPGSSGGSSGGLPSIPGLPGAGDSTGGLPSLPTGLLGGGSKLPIGGGLSGLIPGVGGSTGGDTSGDTPAVSTPAAQPTDSTESSRSEGDSSSSPFGSLLGSAGGSGGFGGSTQNGLNGDCKDVTVIFARGTTEMGNVGTAAGPPFFQALAEQLGSDKLAVQGVDYAASVGGIMQMGDKAGSEKMASLVKQAYQKCPKTKVVMSGYSQGAMLVHNAAKSLPAETTKNIAAVVNFGDPFQRQAVQGIPADRVKIICHTGDGVCAGTAAITPEHLTYSRDANAAAQFVVSKVK
ncbi:cutinase precursor [Fusarium austroafricanum]|uniref:Cutinase n=1 Tax=Fusarium austroafricanum TaxID=2364996 RepID=A0A8H4NUW8_9HYPO|nr:cutinase precursor [Fusarium austroafricanum]